MFFLWLGLWLLHVWVFWRLISFDSCGKLPWGQPLFLFLRRLPFFFSPVQPCRPFVRAECIHSRLQMLTMRNMTYIYFLGETILRIRNNCRENCSQFWQVGGGGGGTTYIKEGPLWSLASTTTSSRRRRRRRRRWHEREADRIQHLSQRWDGVDPLQVVQWLSRT